MNALASNINDFAAAVRAERDATYVLAFYWEGSRHDITLRAPDRATAKARVERTYQGAEVIIAMRLA